MMERGGSLGDGVRRFTVRGHAVEVRCDPPGLVAPFERLLGGFPSDRDDAHTVYELRSQTDPRPGFVLTRDDRLVRTARSPEGLVDFVLWEVFQEALRSELETVAIHAGAVSHRGRALLLPAPMNEGKSTLVAALVCAGFDYLSDEAALIGMDGTLEPFPKPLTFEPGSYGLLPELRALARSRPGLLRQHVAADDLRPDSSGTPSEIAWVMTLSRRAGSPTGIRPLARGEALAALAKNSFNLDRLGARGIDVLGSVVRGATTLRLEVGDVHDAVRAIARVVGATGTGAYATSQQNTNSM